ncbi:MAG: hypothetical protein GY801_41850 [bacterium]|nr:hypothetical protein [bacterium]
MIVAALNAEKKRQFIGLLSAIAQPENEKPERMLWTRWMISVGFFVQGIPDTELVKQIAETCIEMQAKEPSPCCQFEWGHCMLYVIPYYWGRLRVTRVGNKRPLLSICALNRVYEEAD